jgi:formylglycine-generating enzyme required for sulfatase activity
MPKKVAHRLLPYFFLSIILPGYVTAQQPGRDTIAIPGCSRPLVLVNLPAGKFVMGSANPPINGVEQGPPKQVQLDAFAISIYETTWEQYDAFFRDNNFSVNKETDAITRPSPPYLDFTLGMGKEGFPASSMQPYGALMFCKWLYKQTGIFYRLPTEAEWEYACKAGKSYEPVLDSIHLQEYAWFAGNSQQKYQPAGSLKPNAWGIYDMLGNVAEWTLDGWTNAYFSQTLEQSTENPLTVPQKKLPRPVRGGSYRDHAAQLHPALRIPSDPVWNRRDPQIPKSKWWNTDAPFVGFRVVRPARQPDAAAVEAFFNQYLIK